MKNFKKFVTLFLVTFLFFSNSSAGNPSLKKEGLSENTKHNEKIINQLPNGMWMHITTLLPPPGRCSNVVELDLSRTNITDNQLENILSKIGKNLRTLKLCDCRDLNNFEAIKNYCTNNLNLTWTYITTNQLKYILDQIGGNLRRLILEGCYFRNNFEVKNCTQLQELDLSNTNITDNQLADILNQMGGNLRTFEAGTGETGIIFLNGKEVLNFIYEKMENFIV